MKVKELIAELQKVDGERLIILSSDEECNRFAPLEDIEVLGYVEDDADICLENLTEELIELLGYTEEDVNRDSIPAVALIPRGV